MSDDSIQNPHDRFVRRFLSEIEQVRDLVSWRLPAAVLAELDLDSIKPAKQSFVSQTLRDNMSDLVFDVRLARGGQALVVLLFEHKSVPDEMTPFQVLRYIVGICDERHRNGQPLCCVIPIVLYHGRQPWRIARTLPELVDVSEALKEYVPQFTMPLIDLSQCSDDELRGESVFLATMSLLKYIQRDELPERLPSILRLFRQLLPPATALESLEAILRYLVSGTDRISRDQLRDVVTESLQSQGETLMPTIAEQWREEGIEKGIEKGLEKGIEKGLEKGREEGELIGQIRALQGVLKRDISERETLTKLSAEDLEHMAAELAAAIGNQAG